MVVQVFGGGRVYTSVGVSLGGSFEEELETERRVRDAISEAWDEEGSLEWYCAQPGIELRSVKGFTR